MAGSRTARVRKVQRAGILIGYEVGQLITYAAGLQAVTIVWIAERFTEEHRAALDWLNERTDEKINLFGLEIELWRIGDSPIAPKIQCHQPTQ